MGERTQDATRAMLDRDDFLDENPQYADGTCRAAPSEV